MRSYYMYNVQCTFSMVSDYLTGLMFEIYYVISKKLLFLLFNPFTHDH